MSLDRTLKNPLACHSDPAVAGEESPFVSRVRFLSVARRLGRTAITICRARFLASLGMTAITVFAFGSTPAWSQQEMVSQLKEKVSKAGVFFRADAPRVLRNSNDPCLPLYLEIINGVEKTAHTTGAGLSQYITREPLKLLGLNLFVKPAGAGRQFVADLLPLGESKDFSFDARSNGQPLTITDRMKKTLEVPRESIDTYLRQHFIGGPFHAVDLWVSFRLEGWPTQDFYLRVDLNAPPLPSLPGWYRGDVHYHCGYTDNPAERGYPLSVTKQTALHAGLDWLILTDHSTDLSVERYAQELQEVQKYRDGRLMLIRGEEITTASSKQTLLTTVHMLALPSPDNPEKGFPNPSHPQEDVILSGDGSVASAALPIKEALSRIAAAGGFAYAAHPFDPISPLMRGGSWDLDADFLAPEGKQLQAGLVGLEPWNRATMATADDARDPYCLHRDADPEACFQPDSQANQYARLEKGIELGWRPLLQRGLQASGDSTHAPGFKVFLAAGSDAHGDFNYEATLDVVDFLGKPSRGLSGYAEDNALGKISTVVYAPEGMGPKGENILGALKSGRSVLSNGPLLIAGLERNSHGSLGDSGDVGIGDSLAVSLGHLPPLQLAWVSSAEFGPIESIRLIVGSQEGESQPQEIPVPASRQMASGGLIPVDLRPFLGKNRGVWGYIRLEARTRNATGEEFRCYTNPVWLEITGD